MAAARISSLFLLQAEYESALKDYIRGLRSVGAAAEAVIKRPSAMRIERLLHTRIREAEAYERYSRACKALFGAVITPGGKARRRNV